MTTVDRIQAAQKGDLIAMGDVIDAVMPWVGRLCGSIAFDGVLRKGWFIMRSKHAQIGMAAHPENPTQTRFIHFESSSLFGRLARPFFAWNIRRDFRRLRSLLAPMD